MIDKSSFLKSQGSLYLEFIPKDGLLQINVVIVAYGMLIGWCNINTSWMHGILRILCIHNLGKRCNNILGLHL